MSNTPLPEAEELREKLRYTGPLRIKRDLGIRLLARIDTQAERIAELEDGKALFMKWAQGRCESCVSYPTRPYQCGDCQKKQNEVWIATNWTPAWGIGGKG